MPAAAVPPVDLRGGRVDVTVARVEVGGIKGGVPTTYR
jgi:hypothetical protein